MEKYHVWVMSEGGDSYILPPTVCTWVDSGRPIPNCFSSRSKANYYKIHHGYSTDTPSMVLRCDYPHRPGPKCPVCVGLNGRMPGTRYEEDHRRRNEYMDALIEREGLSRYHVNMPYAPQRIRETARYKRWENEFRDGVIRRREESWGDNPTGAGEE